VEKKYQLWEVPVLTAKDIAAIEARNFYDEYLALHPAEKVWADRAMQTSNYAERKRCWAIQEKVRQGLSPPEAAYDRGFAAFALEEAAAPPRRKPRPLSPFDALQKDWEPPKT
jgi:hypothetical protein